MTHEVNWDRVTAPPSPPEALTDAQQKKKPWAKPTVLVIDDGTVEAVLGGVGTNIAETGNDAYLPS